MALSNNLAPPFYPSATLSPSISLHAAPWRFVSHLTLIAPKDSCGWMNTAFLLHFPLLVFYDKDLLSSPPPPSTLSVSTLSPHPQQPLALSAKPDRCSPISSHHKSSSELATNTSAMLIYGRCPPRLSQKEAAKCCRLHVDGIDFLIESLLKIRGPTFTSYLWRERERLWVRLSSVKAKGLTSRKTVKWAGKGTLEEAPWCNFISILFALFPFFILFDQVVPNRKLKQVCQIKSWCYEPLSALSSPNGCSALNVSAVCLFISCHHFWCGRK